MVKREKEAGKRERTGKGFVAETLTLDEMLYFGFFILLSVAKGFGFYEGQKAFILLCLPAFGLAFLKILFTSYTRRQWVMQTLLFLLTMIVYYRSREIGIFFIMFMIMGMKNISVKKVFRIGLWVWALCSIVLCLASFTRLEHTIYRVHQKLGLGHIFRWSLGFTHPNILHITYLLLCALIVYELAERYSFKHFLLLMIGNMLVFLYSVSFTGFGIVAILLAGALYVRFRPRFCLIEKLAVNLVLPVCMIFSFVLPCIIFEPRFTYWVQKLNFLLNTRIWLARQFLVPECMSLFGLQMAQLEQGSLAIDNSYIWGFVNYGIVPFALFMLAYLLLIADYSRKQKTRELVIIVCFLAAGFTEQLLFNTSFKNITFLFLGELLFRQGEGAEEYALLRGWKQKLEDCCRKLCMKIAAQPFMQKELYLTLWQARKRYRKQMVVGTLAGMAAGALLCAALYTAPKGYVVQRFYTDGLFDASVYLESAQDVEYEGYRIMNYVDADTPMQIIEGNAVTLETVRYYLGSMAIGALAGYLVMAGTMILTDKERL